jgi:hypothetical protein
MNDRDTLTSYKTCAACASSSGYFYATAIDPDSGVAVHVWAVDVDDFAGSQFAIGGYDGAP